MAYSIAKINELKNDLLATRPSFDEMNLSKVDFSKEMEFAIQAFQANPYLLTMNVDTIKNCLINVALTGLTLSPVMKLAYLVPRKGKLSLDISYMGMIKVVTDTGSVKSIKADVAYEKDVFDIELGSKGFVKHKPFLGAGDRGRKLGAYSIAVLNDGTEHIDFMRWDEIMAIKARSESVKSGKGSPWDSDPDEMACKTVVKRHYKYLPKSDRAILASQAIAFDDENNGIDFEAEQQGKNTESNPHSTPNAPAQDALATDEDFKELFELIKNPIIANIEKYHSNNNLTPTAFTAALVKIQEGNTGLEKSKAEGYIKFLKDEVAYWTTQQPKVEMATTAQVLELMELFADPNLGEVLTVKNGKGELLSKDAFKNALTKMADDKKLTAQQCKAYHDIISKEIEFAKSAK